MSTQMQGRIPAIRIWDVLLLPLQGEIGDDAAAQLANDTLELVQRTTVRGLIIDVTGLWMMDSHLCALLSRLASAASLMGVRSILCGMGADVALTLQTMGLELPNTTTCLSVESALESLGIHADHEHATAEHDLDDDWVGEEHTTALEGEEP